MNDLKLSFHHSYSLDSLKRSPKKRDGMITIGMNNMTNTNNIKNEQIEGIEETLAKLSTPQPKNNETSIYGFTKEEIKKMSEDFKTHLNPETSIHEILTRLFRNEKIRSLETLNPRDDEDDRQKEQRIKTAFYQLQMTIMTKSITKTRLVTHKKGEFMTHPNGDRIISDDGKSYKCYTKDEQERITEECQVPYFDIEHNPNAWTQLKKIVESEVVAPDFKYLREKTCTHTNYNRALDLIRNITKYYQFENPEQFVERFSLLIANAKARGLNIQPKWPVLFSLVGDMGKGKGWLVNKLIESYDDVFETTHCESKYRRLFERFNSFMLTRGFIHLDEKNGLDSNDRETLKSLITEPKVSVELKGKDVMTVKNLVTFLSTTNESIKDVIGLQKDRRIVEFKVIDRQHDPITGYRLDIPEGQMMEWLNELWMVMPCEHPHADRIISELLEESSDRLDTSMREIVISLFNNGRYDTPNFLKGNFVKRNEMRQAIKELGSVRANDVISWCESKNLLRKYANGTTYLNTQVLDEIRKEQQELEEKISNETSYNINSEIELNNTTTTDILNTIEGL